MNPTALQTLSRLMLVSVACCGTAFGGTVVADFAADFSAASNPSGPWTYGSLTTLGGTLTLSTAVTNYGPGSEVQAWSPAGTFWPTVGLNTSNSTVTFGAGNAIIEAPGQGILHPGPTGAFADVRYTASSDFTAELFAQFSGIDQAGTTTDVHILLNGVSLFSGNINAFGTIAAHTSAVHLSSGDVLDFAVGWGGNNNYIDDSTGFYATLTSSETPEPGTWGLIALGLVAITVARR